MSEQHDLIDFIKTVSGEAHLRVESDLGDGFVRLRAHEAERRQAKHDIRCTEDIVVEILRNSRDANASTIYLATHKEGEKRHLICIDDGDGIPQSHVDHVFEPRVTSKLDTMITDRWGIHGRGMALYAIRENVERADIAATGVGLGTALAIMSDTDSLSERSDQSTWPTLHEDDEEASGYAFHGPRNILRSVIEFAHEHASSMDVYMGSPAEIVATLYHDAKDSVSMTDVLFNDDVSSVGLTKRLAYASGADELTSLAQGLGLEISERTAHRILAGSIMPLRPLLKDARKRIVAADATPADLTQDARGLKVAREDLESFSRRIEEAFDDISSKYFLNLRQSPKVRVRGDRITVTLDITKED